MLSNTWNVNSSASFCFLAWNSIQFARAFPGLFFPQKAINNIQINRNTRITTPRSCYMLMLCIITHFKTGTFNLTRKITIFWHDPLSSVHSAVFITPRVQVVFERNRDDCICYPHKQFISRDASRSIRLPYSLCTYQRFSRFWWQWTEQESK